jgi:hypothetical protein
MIMENTHGTTILPPFSYCRINITFFQSISIVSRCISSKHNFTSDPNKYKWWCPSSSFQKWLQWLVDAYLAIRNKLNFKLFGSQVTTKTQIWNSIIPRVSIAIYVTKAFINHVEVSIIAFLTLFIFLKLL